MGRVGQFSTEARIGMNAQSTQDIETSIVIPVYNEAESLSMLIERLVAFVGELNRKCEVILVDDHSQDQSREIILEACEKYDFIRYLRLSSNSGSHVAILAGLWASRGKHAAYLAADLQDPPELVETMIKRWESGALVVWAVRESREGVATHTVLFANLFYWLLNKLSSVNCPPKGADFALIDRRVIEALRRSVKTDPSIGADIAKLGFRSAEISYVKRARVAGKSKWNFLKRITAVIDAFVSHSVAPIRFCSGLGILVSMLGMVYAVVLITMRIFGSQPPEGWTTLAVLVLVLGGVQITMLGVLGEYLVRALRAARAQPLFFIEEERDLAEAFATDLEVKPTAGTH
ncbi:glycosyltransferase family 2 protein [Bremerella sp. JC770]|uniref:glycosyltransferase family 2 protein n=1 Tax=Bremerella sp. JC770 TaxID=3232137 RepID=UPI0034583579